MAHSGGRGPQPKRPEDRARTNAPTNPVVIIPAQFQGQPGLPEFSATVRTKKPDGTMAAEQVAYTWHPLTVQWWAMWGESALSAHFTATDWSELLITARLHSEYWNGDLRLASELRLRTEKFGASPADRLRMNVQLVQGEGVQLDNESKKAAASRPKTAAERFGGVVPAAAGD